MSDLHDDALMPYSTRSPKDSALYERFSELRAQTGDMLSAAMLLIKERDWTPPPRELPCGCNTYGRPCEEHYRPPAIAAE